MSRLSQLIAEYGAGPALLRRAVKGLSAEQLRARPVAGKWSTLEVVCHLADFEPILADRMKRVIAEEKPTLIGADENRFVAALAYHDRDLNEELAIIEATRSQLSRILARLNDDALQRVGIHSERGPLSLEQLIIMAIQHITHHLRFVDEKRSALGLAS